MHLQDWKALTGLESTYRTGKHFQDWKAFTGLESNYRTG
jgi:hypothetical protein